MERKRERERGRERERDVQKKPQAFAGHVPPEHSPKGIRPKCSVAKIALQIIGEGV